MKITIPTISLSAKTKHRSQAMAMLIAMITIIVLANITIQYIPLTLDITEDKEYTLSATTQQTLKSLDDVVTINGYFSKNLNSRLLPIKRRVDDLLGEYQRQAGSNLIVRFVDPKEDTKIQEEVDSMGIPAIQFEILDKDKYEVANGYMGIGILYENKKQVIPVVNSLDTLEYDLTAGIKKVTAKTNPSVAILTSHGTWDMEKEITKVVGSLQQRFDVIPLSLNTATSIEQNIKTIVIAGPKEQFNDWELYLLDQFVMNGGSLVLFNNNILINQNLQGTLNHTGIEKLFSSYGVSSEDSLVGDQSNETASFRTNFGFFAVAYPYWVKITQQGLNKDSAIVNRIAGAVLPWASSLTLAQSDTKTQRTALITSSDLAWRQKDINQIQPQQGTIPASKQSSVLAAQITGKLTSYFTKKTIFSKVLVGTKFTKPSLVRLRC